MGVGTNGVGAEGPPGWQGGGTPPELAPLKVSYSEYP